MKAREIREFILKRAKWVDPRRTVDTFKMADADAEVRRVAVPWMLTTQAIERVPALGADFIEVGSPFHVVGAKNGR